MFFLLLLYVFGLCASVMSLGHFVLSKAGCNWYLRDIYIFPLSDMRGKHGTKKEPRRWSGQGDAGMHQREDSWNPRTFDRPAQNFRKYPYVTVPTFWKSWNMPETFGQLSSSPAPTLANLINIPELSWILTSGPWVAPELMACLNAVI